MTPPGEKEDDMKVRDAGAHDIQALKERIERRTYLWERGFPGILATAEGSFDMTPPPEPDPQDEIGYLFPAINRGKPGKTPKEAIRKPEARKKRPRQQRTETEKAWDSGFWWGLLIASVVMAAFILGLQV